MTAFLAHRGRGPDGPENAIEALAGLPAWVDGVEIDARLSADGVVVLMHDPTVDRTTDGHGLVSASTAAALATLSLGDAVHVPTLQAYLERCAAAALPRIMVDAKQDDPRTLAAIATVVGGSEVADRCVTMVRSVEGMHRFRAFAPTLRLGGLGSTEDNVTERIKAAETAGAELLLVRHGDEAYLANRGVVPRVRAAGLSVGASTINTPEALRAALEDGCDIVLTDATSSRAPVA